jgi:hypothetical protein
MTMEELVDEVTVLVKAYQSAGTADVQMSKTIAP